MGKGFAELRARFRRGALIRALVLGISLGVLASAVALTAVKLMGLPIDPLLLIPIGAAVGLAVFGITLLMLYPSERRLARRLDRRLRFNEKVQTMVAFKEGDAAMVTVQREDTEARLAALTARQLRTGREWIILIAPMLAVAMTVVALLIPVKAEDTPPEEPPIVDPDFDITAIQIQELEDLIQYVKGSSMEPEPRATTVEMLEGLLADLKAATKESVMKERVLSVIDSVRLLVDGVNTADDVSFELARCESEELKRLALLIRNLQYSGVGSALSAIRLTMPEELTKGDLAALAEGYSGTLTTAIGDAGIPENDLLGVQLTLLASGLAEIAERVDLTPMTEIQIELKQLFENVEIDVQSALRIQSYNADVGDTVVKKLTDIFGLTDVPAYEDEDAIVDDVLQPDEQPPETGGDGGTGTGEMEYGSDDTVYDPATGSFVSYGTLINEYQAMALSMIKEGRVPITLEEYITDYFATLFGGFGEE